MLQIVAAQSVEQIPTARELEPAVNRQPGYRRGTRRAGAFRQNFSEKKIFEHFFCRIFDLEHFGSFYVEAMIYDRHLDKC